MSWNKYLTTKYLIPAAIVLVLLVFGTAWFFYYQNQKKDTVNPNAKTTQDEVKKIVAEVSKLVDLPQGETPTVATVTDITKLKDQPFFQKAKNGDKVLIYTQAKKAILYDPVSKKVLDIAPVNLGSSSAQLSQIKIGLRNGTATIGLATKVEADIKKIQPQANIVSKDNAANNTYENTVVVILNDKFKDQAISLAAILKGAKVGSLPQDEQKPKDIDILIILGKDRI